MIRMLLRLIAIGFFGVTLLLSYATFQADKSHKTSLTMPFKLPVYVANYAGHSVPLFNSRTPYGKPTGQLPDQGYYRFRYPGSEKGSWLHGMLNGQEVFIKDPSRQKVVLLSGYPLQLRVVYHAYAVGLVILLLILRITAATRIPRKELEDQLLRSEEIANREREARILEQNSRLEAEEVLSRNMQQVRQLRAENKQHVENQARLKSSAQKSESQLRTEFKEKEHALRYQFEKEAKEIETRLKRHATVEVSRMQAAYDRLNDRYQELKQDHKQLKAEGLVFDIDFDSDGYENLLTGRLYEIYFAVNLLEDSRFEILSWTSDKGFEHGIRVKSHGDPDFLIQYDSDLVFAVECKYRSNFYKKRKPNRIEWGYTLQVGRYKTYQLNERTPVFVLLGIGRKPDNPRHNYLVSLGYLEDRSNGCYWNDEKSEDEQQVVLQDDVYHLYIRNKDKFPAKAIELVHSQLQEYEPEC